MDEKVRNERALFKFSLIAPVINGTITGSVRKYLETICAKSYPIPGGDFKEISPHTVRRWLFEYRRFGLEGLKRRPRNDKGGAPDAVIAVDDCISEGLAQYLQRKFVNICTIQTFNLTTSV
jgi:hypothetical protein